MGFTIPNAADAAFAAQAQVDKVDLDIITAADAGYGITSGAAVTSTGAGNGSVSVASGQVRLLDTLVTVPATTVAIAANASGNPRFDLVTVPAGGVPVATQGVAAATPVFPSVPAGSVVLAAVYVPNGHTATTVIPANTIVDKRVTVSNRVNLEGAFGATGTEFNFQQTDSAKVLMRLRGKEFTGGLYANTLFEVLDYLNAPIAWIGGVGGMAVNDDLYTAYSVFGDYPFRADIYGFQWRKSQCTFAFPGPAGNMLSWENACHEVYQATRAASLGTWGVVANCTLANFDFPLPPTTSPTGYRRGMRITMTATATGWIAQPGGASALAGVVAGDIVSPVFNMRSNVAAAARNAQIRISWYNAGGTQVGADVNSALVSIPNTGVWTKVGMAAQVVPATATRVQMHILLVGTSGESHDIAGCGLMKGSTEATFGPPFVGQRNPADPPTAVGAVAGDRWIRTDTPSVPGAREYICLTGTVTSPALPNNQTWRAMEAANIQRTLVDQAVTTTAVVALNRLSYAVAANSAYTFEWKLNITSAALTTGWLMNITGPASPTSFLATHEYQSSATGWTTATLQAFGSFTLVTAAYAAAPSQIGVRVTLQLVTGATAGTVALNLGTEVAGSAITVKAGSLMNVY